MPEAHRHRRATTFHLELACRTQTETTGEGGLGLVGGDKKKKKLPAKQKPTAERTLPTSAGRCTPTWGGRVGGSRRVVVWPCYCTLEFQAVSLPYYINTKPPCASVGSCQALIVTPPPSRSKWAPHICRNTVCIVSPTGSLGEMTSASGSGWGKFGGKPGGAGVSSSSPLLRRHSQTQQRLIDGNTEL